jgi:Family of unknown function (DUF5335)
MTIRRLDQSAWRSYFDFLSKFLEGKQVEIELASLSMGDQVVAEWLPLLGITYDAKDDLIEVALEGVDHLIRKPGEVYVEDGAGELISIEIVDAEGTRQIVKLRDPLMLPAPEH